MQINKPQEAFNNSFISEIDNTIVQVLENDCLGLSNYNDQHPQKL